MSETNRFDALSTGELLAGMEAHLDAAATRMKALLESCEDAQLAGELALLHSPVLALVNHGANLARLIRDNAGKKPGEVFLTDLKQRIGQMAEATGLFELGAKNPARARFNEELEGILSEVREGLVHAYAAANRHSRPGGRHEARH